jgi:hypothetical protein
MKFYCIALILVLISIASSQPQEFDVANNTSINESSSIVSTQPQECDAPNNININGGSTTSSAQPQEINESSTPLSIRELLGIVDVFSDVFDLEVLVLERNKDTMARFGVGKKEDAKQEMYKISIKNKGDIRIADVIVTAEMDKGMNFESTRYYEENRGKLNVTRNPIEFDEDIKTNLTWDIGILEPEELKSIILEAYIKPEVDNSSIRVNVTGEVRQRPNYLVSASKEKAKVTKCDHKDKITGNSCEKDSENCQEICPDWSDPQ